MGLEPTSHIHRRHRDGDKNFFSPHLRLIGFAGLNINLDRPLSSCARHRHRDSDKFSFSHIFCSSVALAGTPTSIAPCRHVRADDAAAAAVRFFFPHLRFIGCTDPDIDLDRPLSSCARADADGDAA